MDPNRCFLCNDPADPGRPYKVALQKIGRPISQFASVPVPCCPSCRQRQADIGRRQARLVLIIFLGPALVGLGITLVKGREYISLIPLLFGVGYFASFFLDRSKEYRPFHDHPEVKKLLSEGWSLN